ncbi:acyltransferase family protein [Singulisphaera sp. PoT]|uniref:acyltransferase family protein n=1 Tax=Singulisphaera sp. PoT TaxID=3411797 RepID=UPI003BF4955D
MTNEYQGDSPAPPGPSRNIRKFAFIDSLRGWAFLGVFLCHVGQEVRQIPAPIGRVLTQGAFGVQLFFILSALTLFLSLESRRGTEARPLRNFFLRRYFRIAPLFYAAALFYACWPVTRSFNADLYGVIDWRGLVATFTFVHGWSPFWINLVVPGGWSIAVEMTFYLFVPLLFRVVRRADQAAWGWFLSLLAGSILSVVLERYLHAAYGGRYQANAYLFGLWWFPAQLPIFFVGIMAYFLMRDTLDATKPGNYGVSLLMLLASCYLYVALSVGGPLSFRGLPNTLYGLVILLFVWSTAMHPHRLIVNRFLSYLGTVSFSAYITHFAALAVTRGLLIRVWPGLEAQPWPIVLATWGVLAFAMTLGLSTLTYRYIEIPGQTLGKRVIAWLEGQKREERATAGTPRGRDGWNPAEAVYSR